MEAQYRVEIIKNLECCTYKQQLEILMRENRKTRVLFVVYIAVSFFYWYLWQVFYSKSCYQCETEIYI